MTQMEKGTIRLNLSKRRPRWEGCDSTDTYNRSCCEIDFLHSQKLFS